MPFFTKSTLLIKLESLGIRLDKKRGQCYLIDRNIVDLIIRNANLDPLNDTVLEIGAGLGTLSDFLIKNTKRAYLIEFDKKIVNYLHQHFKKQYPTVKLQNPTHLEMENLADFKVVIIHADALEVQFPKVTKIVSNIPYQISAPLLFKIIENWNYSTVNLMVQLDFAKRLVAKVNSKNYSRLSAASGLYLNIKILRKISSSCFYPSPKITSALIEIKGKSTLKSESFENIHRKDYLNFLRGVFPYKNKSLKNAISYYFKNFPRFEKTQPHLKNLIKLKKSKRPKFLNNKVRATSPEQFFNLIGYGITGEKDYLRELRKN